MARGESSALRAGSSKRLLDGASFSETATLQSTTSDNGRRPMTTSTHVNIDPRGRPRDDADTSFAHRGSAANPFVDEAAADRARERIERDQRPVAEMQQRRSAPDARPNPSRPFHRSFMPPVARPTARPDPSQSSTDRPVPHGVPCRMHRQAPMMILHDPRVRPVRPQEETRRSTMCHLVPEEGGRSVRLMAIVFV